MASFCPYTYLVSKKKLLDFKYDSVPLSSLMFGLVDETQPFIWDGNVFRIIKSRALSSHLPASQPGALGGSYTLV